MPPATLAPRPPSSGQVTRVARDARREAAPWVVLLGRFGYVAKGAVYLIIGWLAARTARGAGGATTDSQGALDALVDAPFGHLLLGALAVGLAGYALWCLVRAALDTEGKGSDPRGLLGRGSSVLVGALHAGLALSAARLALGSPQRGGDATRDWSARLLGQALVAGFGLVMLGVGLYHLYLAYSATFRDQLRTDQMGAEELRWVTRLGRAGYAASAVGFGIIGGFLLAAARDARAEEARGLGGALAALAQQPYGPWLLGATALGLMAYGAYSLVEACFRRLILR
jgi:hypothetical protein